MEGTVVKSGMTAEQFSEFLAQKVGEAIEAQEKATEERFKEALRAIEEKAREHVDELVKTALEEEKGKAAKVVVGEEPVEKDPKGGFKSLSHFAMDVARAYKTGMRNISKELETWEKYMSKAAGSPSQSEGDPETGGFLIPEEFRTDIMVAVEQKNELVPRCMQVPMSTNNVNIPFVNGFDESGGLVYGGIEWKWLDEETQKTATQVKFGKIALHLKKVAGLAYISDEMLEDSPVSMENILKKGFADGLNFQINKVLVRGTGAGQPLGILNAPCLVTVAKETGQAAATIVYENILKMYSRVSDTTNAVWIANQDCLPQLATMSIAVGTGGAPVWLPAGGASGKPYDTLMGLPLLWNKHCSTVGTVGDIILCDWSQYLLGMKAGQGFSPKFDTSIHLKFDYDQTAFRFTFRVDGQPWWPSALTPPHGSNTISPFVALATRS